MNYRMHKIKDHIQSQGSPDFIIGPAHPRLKQYKQVRSSLPKVRDIEQNQPNSVENV